MKIKILVFVGLLVAIIIMQIFVPDLGQTHIVRMEPTGLSVSYNFDDSPSFHSHNGRFFYTATRDGMFYRTANMELRWSESFNFSNPIMVTRGDIVAVGDRTGGRMVYVFNPQGLMFSVDFGYPVQFFNVNATGILSAIVQKTYGSYIYVYSPQSARAGESIFYERAMGDMLQPTGVDVSPDGRYIAIATLDTEIRMQTIITFRYLNEADALAWRTEEGLFSAEVFHGEIVTSIRFMAGDRLLVTTPSRIVCFQINARSYAISTQDILWVEELTNVLTHLDFYNDRYFAYIVGERNIGEMEGSDPGTLYIKNIDGHTVGTFSMGRNATHISMGSGAVIVGSDRNFHAIGLTGTHLWEHNSIHDTRDVIFVGDTDTILVAGQNRAEINTRQRVRNGPSDSQLPEHSLEINLDHAPESDFDFDPLPEPVAEPAYFPETEQLIIEEEG